MSQTYYQPKPAQKGPSHFENRNHYRKNDHQDFDDNREFQPRKDQRKVNNPKEFDQERVYTPKDSQRSYNNKYHQNGKESSYPSERNYGYGYNQRRNFNKNQETQENSNRDYGYQYVKKEEYKHEGPKNENRDNQAKHIQNQNKGQTEENQTKKKVTFDLNQEKQQNNNHNKGKGGEVVYYVKKEQEADNKTNSVEEHKGERKRKNDKRQQKNTQENNNTIAENISTGQENKKEQAKKIEDNVTTKNENKQVELSNQQKRELAERTAASLLNKKDDPSPSVPKPFLGSISNVKSPSIEGEKDQSCLISDTESTASKQALSTPNNPRPTNSTSTSQNEQPKMMYAPGFNGLQMPALFQTPYIVFPQPNGTSIIQPLYQYPFMNMGPRNPEDDQSRQQQQQPFYLVSSHLLPSPENQARDNSRVQPIPIANANMQFPFPQMQPIFLNPLIGNPLQVQTQQSGERDFQKSATSDTPSKDETLSDRRDD